MATSPAFASTPVASGVSTAAAASTTPYSAPSAAVTVYTAPAAGARIDEVLVQAMGTSNNANSIILYVHNGTTYWPIKSILTQATTPSATVAPFSASVTFNNLFLPNASYSLRAAIVAADTTGYMVTAFGGTF